MRKVLIIDDDIKLCKAIKRYAAEDFTVDYVNDGDIQKLQHLLDSNFYDGIVFDLEIGEINGLELYEKFKGSISCAVIFLSGTSSSDIRINALNAGADDFLQKPIDLRELLVRLKKVISNSSASHIEIYADYTINTLTEEIYKGNKKIKLPPKADKLLKYLIRNPNRDLARKELLETVWQYYDVDGNRIIDTNINLIRTETRDEKILTVRGVGYRYETIR